MIEFAGFVLGVGILILGSLKHNVNRSDCHVDASGAKKCIAKGTACHDDYDCQSLDELVVRDLGASQFDGVVSKSQDHCGEKHGPESLPVTLEAFSIGGVLAEVSAPSWQQRCNNVDPTFRNFCMSLKRAVIRVRVLLKAVVIVVLFLDLILHVVNVHNGKVSKQYSEESTQEL